MWRDFSFSLRTLLRSPIFAAVAVVSLALGIGANTAIFSLVDQVILRLLPVRNPQSLVLLHREYNLDGSSTADNYESVFSFPMYRELRDYASCFDGVIARTGSSVTLIDNGAAESVDADIVSGNFFNVLGVAPAAGRLFTTDDDRTPGAHPVVVLSHRFWAKRFAAAPSVVGRKLAVNGTPMTVIGVAAVGFNGIFSGNDPDLYMPLMEQRVMKPTWDALDDAQFRWLNLMARLAPGVTIERARAAVQSAHRAGMEIEIAKLRNKPDSKTLDSYRLELLPAAQGINELRRRQENPLLALMAMAGLVLLIACANVASLMIARSTARQRELGIRLAIGATRWDLVRQLFMEGTVLAAAGGALSLAVAAWCTRGLLAALPEDYAGNWLQPGLNPRMLAFAFIAAAFSVLLFALLPAFQASRRDIAGALRASATFATGHALWMRKAVVAAQIALSLILAVAAGLFSGTLYNLAQVNLGFRTERLLTFKVDAGLSRPQIADAVAYYRDLERRISAIPGVTGVAASASGPFSNQSSGSGITVQGYTAKPHETVGGTTAAISAGYFAAMGIPLRGGREFDLRDAAGAPKTVIVNESFVKKYCAGRNAVGVLMAMGGGKNVALDREIVGVVADSLVGVHDTPDPTIYFPYAQSARPDRLAYYVRAANGDETALAGAIRAAARAADPNIAIIYLSPVSLRIHNSLFAERLLAMLSGAFGALAILLAAIGLYGVSAYSVARRTGEIGLRMALGALPSDVLRMILLDAVRLTIAGLAAGAAVSLALGRLIQSQLFGIRAGDIRIYAAAIALLAAISLAAAFIPSLRASRVTPVKALKYE